MRTWLAALLLMLAVGLAACGDATEAPVVDAGAGATTETTRTPRTTGTAPAADDGGDGDAAAPGRAPARRADDCVARGITAPPFAEGACRQDGTRYVVANGRSLLELKTMTVAIRGFSVVEQLRRGGEVLTPQGAFMRIELEVRNVTDEPRRFASGQTLLLFEERRLEEHDAAQERFAPDALASARRAPIAPGRADLGVVIYDVPVADVQEITRSGQLLVANLGGRSGGAPREIGLFRIGAG